MSLIYTVALGKIFLKTTSGTPYGKKWNLMFYKVGALNASKLFHFCKQTLLMNKEALVRLQCA